MPMSQTLHQSEATPSAQTLPSINHDNSLPRELLDHIDRLRLILPVISVSVMALNRQDAESDTDIAFVLHELIAQLLRDGYVGLGCRLGGRLASSGHPCSHSLTSTKARSGKRTA